MKLIRYHYPIHSLAPVASVFGRSPWAGLDAQINQLFETALGENGRNGYAASERFPVDVYEDKANTYVRAELPGFARENINVEMADGFLTISAKRPAAEAGKPAEESFSFSRSVNIADDIEAEKVGALYENGVLTVTLPKREEVKPKKVNVTVK